MGPRAARATVVLVHGAWPGAGCGELVVAHLDAAGRVGRAVEWGVAHSPFLARPERRAARLVEIAGEVT
jgi:hypothetical protein